MRTLLILFLFFSSINTAFAAVWKVNRVWSEDEELSFSRWVENDFMTTIFSNPGGPYYGIKTDCADAALIIRAIYSYENNLPFSFKSIDGVEVNESIERFDQIPDESRFIYFANWISDYVSVNSLAHKNTYSIHPKDIRPGDLYLVSWLNPQGKINNHAYIVKSILPTGDLEMYSSTTPKMKRTLSTRKGMPLHLFNGIPYGFRRFKNANSVARERDSDLDMIQYDWQKLGEKQFFSLVKNELKKVEDSYSENFKRRFFNLCDSFSLRYEIVNEAQLKISERNGKCLSGTSLDEFSTPSRDQNIAMEFERIIHGWKTILRDNISHNLSNEEEMGLNYLIGKNNSLEAKAALDSRCRVNIPLGTNGMRTMGLRDFYMRQKNGVVSSNPNDTVLSRYGLDGAKRACSN